MPLPPATSRTQTDACDTASRLSVRTVLCRSAVPSAPPLPSTASAPGPRPGLFGRFPGTMSRSDFSGPFISGVRPKPSRCGPEARPPGGPEISRFPRRWFPDTHGVSDRAGPTRTSPWRCAPCGLPLFSTASAPRSFNISRLNTQLASAPVNASPAPSRVTPHELGVVVDGCSFDVRLFHPLPSAGLPAHRERRPRFPPLLQSVLFATFSAAVTGAERRRFCGHFRAHLEGARAEREPELVSGRRRVSGA